MSQHNDLIVIGAGQMRTGTMSMKYALEILYPDRKCYHMIELIRNHPEHIGKWNIVFKNGHLTRDLANDIFQDYSMETDFPACLFYKDLINLYPNAKVILTLRDSKSWYKSVKNTTMNQPPIHLRLINCFSSFWRSFGNLKKNVFQFAYGYSSDELLNNEQLFRECFDKYNKEVVENVPSDKLLIFNQGDGWDKLCPFLNVPIPSVPYPHVNTTEEFNSKQLGGNMKKYITYTTILITTVAIIFHYIRIKNN